MVGRRDEAPLVPPYSLLNPNKAMALSVNQHNRLHSDEATQRTNDGAGP